MKKLNKEQINQDLESQGRTIRLIGEYIGSKIKTEFLCLICNDVWEAIPNNIRNGKGCPKCAGLERLTKEQVNKELEYQGRTIRLVGEYINARTKSEFYCIACENTWLVLPYSIRGGSGCPKCADTKLTKERVNEDLQKDGRTVHLIGDYLGAHNKTEFYCNTCFNIWNATPNNICKGTGCPVCATTSWDLSGGFIYIFQSFQGTKIGISNSPNKRLTAIKSSSNISDLSIFGTYTIGNKTKQESYTLEQTAHNYFANKNCGYKDFDGATEFFNITPQEAESYLLSLGAIKC